MRIQQKLTPPALLFSDFADWVGKSHSQLKRWKVTLEEGVVFVETAMSCIQNSHAVYTKMHSTFSEIAGFHTAARKEKLLYRILLLA